MNFLSGYKTYLTAFAGLATIAAGYASGHVTPVEAVVAGAILAGQAFQRAGSKTDARKVVAEVSVAAAAVASLAPIVGRLAPGSAMLVTEAGQIAGVVHDAADQVGAGLAAPAA